MSAIFNIQFGTFSNSNPSWFDWFALFFTCGISILSIWGGYLIAKRFYSNEKKDRIEVEKILQESEVKLFKNSLNQLKIALGQQLSYLNHYLKEQNFSVKMVPGIQIDFLQYITIKNIYNDAGIMESKKIKKINLLLSSLYGLSDFRTSLRDQFRTFNKKYNYHEGIFFSYKKLLYTKYYELCNRRSEDVKFEGGIKTWKLSQTDMFMIEYTSLRKQIFKDKDVISENGVKSRELMDQRFIIPLIKLAAKYIPEDTNAIEILDLSNHIHAAYSDMEEVTSIHIQAVKSYSELLKSIHKQIETYLNS